MANRNGNQWLRIRIVVVATIVALGFAACSVTAMIHGNAKRPADSEFGPGPRTSANGLYTATVQPAESLRPRKMQTIQVDLRDAKDQAIDGAAITVDGGMPSTATVYHAAARHESPRRRCVCDQGCPLQHGRLVGFKLAA